MNEQARTRGHTHKVRVKCKDEKYQRMLCAWKASTKYRCARMTKALTDAEKHTTDERRMNGKACTDARADKIYARVVE